MELFISPDSFYPAVNQEVLIALRGLYALIMIGTLLITLPNRRFFLSEKWRGYAQSSRDVNILHNPVAYPIVQILWLGSCVLLLIGQWSVVAALVNVIFCRYFFIYMRWKGIARGMGAPGFMSYWMGTGILLLEFAHAYTPQLMGLVLLVIQVDLALIMLSAGFYKLNAGYAHDNGMELGAANPQWSFWSKFYTHRPPDSWLMKAFNHLAWITELAAGFLMLIPPFRFTGALLIFGSFGFLTTQIRLGWLAQLVMLCCGVFFHPGSLGDIVAKAIIPVSAASVNPAITLPAWVSTLVAVYLWAYLVLLPFAHLGISFNFYMKKRLPETVQWALERFAAFYGIIVWRVFSQDLVNFYILIYQNAPDGSRNCITTYGWAGGGFMNRYNHVCESIVITTLFTTLKYYPNNPALFKERILRYARTLPAAPGQEFVFVYYTLRKKPDGSGVDHVPVSEFIVNCETKAITENRLDESFSSQAPISISPIHEAAYPGTYAPAPQRN